MLSFHPVKQITTGEGGAVLCSGDETAARLRRLRDHGREPSAGAPGGGPMVELGLNGRLSDISAALGTSQLRKLPAFLEARRRIATRYFEELADASLPEPGGEDVEHAWHLFVVRVRDRDALLTYLRRQEIHGQVHYPPVPRQPWFADRAPRGEWPHAEEHARTALSLPIYPSLEEADQARVIDALRRWQGRNAA